MKLITLESTTIYPTKPKKILCMLDNEPNGVCELQLDEQMIMKNICIVRGMLTQSQIVEVILANHNAVTEIDIVKNSVIGSANIFIRNNELLSTKDL